MNKFPRIETERLVLAELRTIDVPQIVKYASNKNISDNTLNIPFPYTEGDAVFWINMAEQGFKDNTNIIFGIRLKETDGFIGGIGLTIESRFSRAELGYWIAEPFWNQGLTTEAAKAVIRFGFEELGLNKLTCSHFEKNPASGKVIVKSGMKKEGYLKEHVHRSGIFHDLVVYGLTKRDAAGLK